VPVGPLRRPRYVLKPKGATFTGGGGGLCAGVETTAATGIAVDTSGRIFVTSHYLGGNVVTRMASAT